MSATARPAPLPIAISGLGVCCVAGDEPVGAWSAAVLNLGVAAPDPATVAPRADGQGMAPAMAVPIAALEETGLGGEARLAEMVRRAAAALPLKGLDLTRVRVWLALPPKSRARRGGVRESALIDACLRLWPGLPRENIHLIDAGDGLAAPLLGPAREALQTGLCDAAVVGAVDTLVNKATYLELNNQHRLMIEGDASGVIPGEGGAFLLFEPEAQARARGAEVRALLTAVAHAPEPHPGAADLHTATGLPAAIEAALAQAALAPAAIGGMVLATGLETADHLELYQTTQRLWPWRIDERQRLAMELDELDPAALELPDDPVPPDLRTCIAFGELGAATLPLQLLLAAEWFAADRRHRLFGIESARQHLLVCETGDMPRRGAVIVSAPGPAVHA